MGYDIENNNDAIRPDVVPPKIRTNAKITIEDNEIKTTGKRITKS